MKFVIQRVTQAQVTVADEIIASIDRGFVVLCGICNEDTTQIADKMLLKMLNLRIFADENGKTNLSLKEVKGELLIVSQFTLYADCRKGNRPSFLRSGSAAHAQQLYEYVLSRCRENGYPVQSGEFGADMKVSLINDGPFTVVLDSDEIC